MNRDEAVRCVELARNEVLKGNVQRALRLAEKSVALHPNEEATLLVEELRSRVAGASSAPSSSSPSSTSSTTKSAAAAAASRQKTAGAQGNGDARAAGETQADGAVGGAAGGRETGARARPASRHGGDEGEPTASAAASSSAAANSAPKRSAGKRTSGGAHGSKENDVAAVRRIATSHSLYKVLSVTRDASDAEIRRAYRTHALRFHPDKNKTAGAEDAFKRVGHAFQVLSNPQKRRMYDQHGAEDEQALIRQRAAERQAASGMRQRRGQAGNVYVFGGGDPFADMFFGGFGGPEMSAEELFQAFFFGGGGGLGGGVAQQRARRATAAQRQAEARAARFRHGGGVGGATSVGRGVREHYALLLQLLPLLLFVVLPSLLSMLSPAPMFSIDARGAYRVPMRTRHTDLPYFVQRQYIHRTQGASSTASPAKQQQQRQHGGGGASDKRKERERVRVERQVEQEWTKRFAAGCRSEHMRREQLMEFARASWTAANRQRYEQAAAAVDLAACQRYEELRNKMAAAAAASGSSADDNHGGGRRRR